MNKLFALAVLALPFAFAGCHSCEPELARFWEVRDSATGVTAYTVDTAMVTAYSMDAKYVNASGTYVNVDQPTPVRQISQAEWVAATSGAGFGLHYCPMRKQCWASVREK
jgi:hypothetical protein